MNIQEVPVGGHEVVKFTSCGRWVVLRPVYAEDGSGRIVNIETFGDEFGLSSWRRRRDAVQATVRLAYHELASKLRQVAKGGNGQAQSARLAQQLVS